jgi:ubiquinone/menaquinone biosynthesis C-methylase UbiE
METQAKGLWGEITATIRDKAGRLCGKAEGRLLDVGCGNGLFFSALGNQRDLRLFGLDRSWELLSEARETVDPLRLIRGVMGELPFQDWSFDWVVCLSTLYNLSGMDEVEHALREMIRICKPGGRVLVDIRNRANPYIRLKYWWHGIWSDFPVRAYTLSQFVDVFREEGFDIERVVSIGPDWSRLALAYLIQARRRK